MKTINQVANGLYNVISYDCGCANEVIDTSVTLQAVTSSIPSIIDDN